MAVTVLSRPAMFAKIRVLPNRIRAGVAILGAAAAYGVVWEWGTVRFRQPGPKTTWGSNPDDGSTRIFTITAPSGYVRIHKHQFYDMVRLAVTSISVQRELQAGTYEHTLTSNLMKAATEAAQIMAKDAPIDTGLLRASIMAVSGEKVNSILQAAFRPLIIGDSSDAQ